MDGDHGICAIDSNGEMPNVGYSFSWDCSHKSTTIMRMDLEVAMQVALDWKQGMSFRGSAPSGFSLDLSAYAAVGGAGDGFAPVELVALGLGGCTGMDVISILQKKKQDVHAFEVRVKTERKEEHPRIWTRAVIEYIVTGKNIDPAALERAIQLSSDKYCPVQNMLRPTVEIETSYEIREA